MKPFQAQVFLQNPEKEVIKFVVIPQLFCSSEHAIHYLNYMVFNYNSGCGKPFSEFRETGNPFSVIIIHEFEV